MKYTQQELDTMPSIAFNRDGLDILRDSGKFQVLLKRPEGDTVVTVSLLDGEMGTQWGRGNIFVRTTSTTEALYVLLTAFIQYDEDRGDLIIYTHGGQDYVVTLD